MATLLVLTLTLATLGRALRYDPAYDDWNLNKNKEATDPTKYSAPKLDKYTPSPTDWRFPFYTLFMDRLANGDPRNDNINGTVYEQDITSNQLRHGGDCQGVIDSLDYIQGMGMKVGQGTSSAALGRFANLLYRASTLLVHRSLICLGVLIHIRSVLGGK